MRKRAVTDTVCLTSGIAAKELATAPVFILGLATWEAEISDGGTATVDVDDRAGDPLTGESGEQRKTGTVLFCDLTGSTKLGESTDREAFHGSEVLSCRHFWYGPGWSRTTARRFEVCRSIR